MEVEVMMIIMISQACFSKSKSSLLYVDIKIKKNQQNIIEKKIGAIQVCWQEEEIMTAKYVGS